MRRTRYALVTATVVLAAALSSCSGGVGFNITRPVPEQTVAGDPVAHAAAMLVGDRAPINPFELNIDLASEQSAAGVVVRRVLLNALSFTITPTARPAGDEDCWDFVESVTVRAESTRPGTTLPPVTIAEGTRPGCVETFVLTPTPGVNLKPYIEEGVRLSTTGSGIPPADDVSFDGTVIIRAEPF